MEIDGRFVVVGATGRVGRHVADLLAAEGREVVGVARSTGVDVVTGAGLDAAVDGASVILDLAGGRSGEPSAARQFWGAAAANLSRAGQRAGVHRIVVVSIIGVDRYTGGYGAAKYGHEQATLAGPIPARVLRAGQFHEFVPHLMEWGRQGDIVYVPAMRTQLVAARAVAQRLVELATDPDDTADGSVSEIAGPREERLATMAQRFADRTGMGTRVEEVVDPNDPDDLNESGGLLPGPAARLAGPTFEAWLEATFGDGEGEEAAQVRSRLDSAQK